MSIQLRPYQEALKNDIYRQWAQVKNVIAVLPTGGGKAFLLCFIAREFTAKGHKVVIQVHRRELIAQLSCSLASIGVVHYVIGSKATVEFVKQQHLEKFGRIFIDNMAKVCVASVQTLIKDKSVPNWASSVGLKVIDEAHHTLRSNVWGQCWDLFPNAYGLGVTGSPRRTAGEGLGSHADGVFDRMVIGPTMRELINMGNLCDYKVFVPPTDFKVGSLKTGSNGDYTAASVEEALTGSHVVGDAVNHYMKFIPNKQAIVFASSIEKSNEMADAFNAAGIPSASVSSKDDDVTRARAMKDFMSGKLKVLSNQGLFDEGLDIPNLVGVIDAAPTTSTIKFLQRFGRALRVCEGKSHGVYIDMVSNIKIENRGIHALPDAPRVWSLDRERGRSSEEENNILKLTSCLSCFQPYLSSDSMCPHCGTPKPVPTVRGSTGPIEIDDQLVELTPQRCAALRGEIDEARMDSNEWMVDKFGTYASGIIPMKQRKNHKQRKETLLSLDSSIANWAGVMRDFGMSDDEIRHGFQREFGMSIYEARVLKRADADKLISKLVL